VHVLSRLCRLMTALLLVLGYFEHNLSLSWSDNSLQPRSRVAQLRLRSRAVEAHTGGSKDVWGHGYD
jgi:hypothetical protein